MEAGEPLASHLVHVRAHREPGIQAREESQLPWWARCEDSGLWPLMGSQLGSVAAHLPTSCVTTASLPTAPYLSHEAKVPALQGPWQMK